MSSNNTQKIDQKMVTFDAYVCYSDKDFEFVKQLSKYLESEPVSDTIC